MATDQLVVLLVTLPLLLFLSLLFTRWVVQLLNVMNLTCLGSVVVREVERV